MTRLHSEEFSAHLELTDRQVLTWIKLFTLPHFTLITVQDNLPWHLEAVGDWSAGVLHKSTILCLLPLLQEY